MLLIEPDEGLLLVVRSKECGAKALFGAGGNPESTSSSSGTFVPRESCDDDFDDELTCSIDDVSHSIIADVIASGRSVNVTVDPAVDCQSLAPSPQSDNKLIHTFEILAALGAVASPAQQRPRSLLCVPIKGAQGQVMGVLQAVNSFTKTSAATADADADGNGDGSAGSLRGSPVPTTFSQADERLLRHLAQHAGITIGKSVS
jgi:GAF domain-containing protein